MSIEISDLRKSKSLSLRELEEIARLTRVSMTDSHESLRIRTIQRLGEILYEKYFVKLRAGFQGDGMLMLSHIYNENHKGIYYIAEVPLNGFGIPIETKPFLVSNRGMISFPYRRRCGFEELK